MSKRCPSTAARPKARNRRHLQSSAISAAWQRRIFRNSFTRRGKTYRVKGWAFKIQLDGRRRTFSLAGGSRAAAAREARALYYAVLTQGWEAAVALNHLQLLGAGRLGDPRKAVHLAKSDLRYWEQRLIQCRYREARLGVLEEHSVRIQEAGAHAYFPLGSLDPRRAAAKARDIHATILAEGWTAAFERYEREITLAIFWADNPAAVTYTTLFTLPHAPPADRVPPVGARPRKNILALEPDPTTHSCLRYWLDRQPGFACSSICANSRAALKALEDGNIALVLVNRVAPDMMDLTGHLDARWPAMPVFPYRIHEESDQIFISISGVSGGYLFRRRVPTALFEPLQSAARLRKLTALEAGRYIRSYFQNFFGEPATQAQPLATVALTNREQEILNHLSRGCLDKEIADLLHISIWTVHNHVKNIYEKLGVHHRTEAVAKYLQR
jgi:DNA-binding NarL/FixJ family response regulator